MGQLMTITNRHINAREDTPITVRFQQRHIGLTDGFLSTIVVRQSMITFSSLLLPYSSKCLSINEEP